MAFPCSRSLGVIATALLINGTAQAIPLSVPSMIGIDAAAVTYLDISGVSSDVNEESANSNAPGGVAAGNCSPGLTLLCSSETTAGLATVSISAGRTNQSSTPPDPKLNVSARSSAGRVNDSYGRPLGIYNASASATLDYYFEVVPNGEISAFTVPLNLVGSITQTPTQDQAAANGAVISTQASVAVFQVLDSGNIAPVYRFDGAGSINSSFITITQTMYLVSLSAQVSAADGFTAAAYIDPLLTIDPLFANDYTIVYSPDLYDADASPTSPIPEPGGWAILLVGIGSVWLAKSRAAKTSRLS